jgi:hypothetical protein
MQNTWSIFEDRKNEIEFYYSIMVEINNESEIIRTVDNRRFFKICKSNLILMLYNLVEACTVNGMLEIYDSLKEEQCSYDEVIDEIKNIWTKSKISEIYGPTTAQATYENRIKEVINDITNEAPIKLTRNALGISGNLDAKKIKDICDMHRIRYRVRTDGVSLKQVKDKRNDLAHGDISFSSCMRDLTIEDLGNIKDEVCGFLSDILEGMEKYYDNKLYINQNRR